MKNFHLDIGMSLNLKSLELFFTKRLTYTIFAYNRSRSADEAKLVDIECRQKGSYSKFTPKVYMYMYVNTMK